MTISELILKSGRITIHIAIDSIARVVGVGDYSMFSTMADEF